MNNKISHPENGALHKCLFEISNIVEALKYAKEDPGTCFKAAGLIGICIHQLNKNIRYLNEEFGSEWPENK